MGGGMEADLTHGAVAAMWTADGLRPVLQVAGAPAARGHGVVRRYRVLLSDGVHSQQAFLQPSLNGLVATGRLRDGSVVRVLDYVSRSVYCQRVIIVIQLEVLQFECTLIGSPTIYQGLLRSSVAAREELAVNPFYGPVRTQITTNAKMQQLSLNSDQVRRHVVPPIGLGFGRPGNTCGRPEQSLYQQQPPVYMNRGPVANNDALSYVTPIAALNPYQGRWTIKGRVTAKTDIRHFGAGKVFSFDLLDAQGGEIRAICFNSAVDQFCEQIVVGNVYLITGGLVKPTQKMFNHLNSEYEVLLDTSSSIEICSSDDSDIPGQQYNFRQISEIQNLHNGHLVDLLGVVTSVNPSVTVTQKNGMEIQRRTLQLKDMSGCSVQITLWGDFCKVEGQQLHSMCVSGFDPVLALKGGCVNEYNGKSVATVRSSLLEVNPDVPSAERLMQWYITEGEFAGSTSLSQEIKSMSKTIAQIKDENLGRSDKPDWITVEGTISHINTDVFCYPACTMGFDGKRCYRKVTRNGDGMWHCPKCGQSSQDFEYRYLLQCQIQDHTGTTFATAFQEAGEDIIGLRAEELYMINMCQDDAEFAGIIQRASAQLYLFKLKIKEEIYGDETRVKVSIAKADRLDGTLKKSSYVPRASDPLSVDGFGPRSVVSGVAAVNAGFPNPEGRQNMVTSKNTYAKSRASHPLSVDGLGPRPVVSGVAAVNAGFPNPESRQNAVTSKNTYAMSLGRANHQFGQQQEDVYVMANRLSAARYVQTCTTCGSALHNVQNCPASMGVQKPAAGGGFTEASSHGSSAGSGFKHDQPEHLKATSDASSAGTTTFKCDQSGHLFKDCPALKYGRPAHFAGLCTSG